MGNATRLCSTSCSFDDEIKGKPIKLLDAIAEHTMSYVKNKCPLSTALDPIKNYINLKQIDDESLVDYTRRYKEMQIGGELELPKLAKLDPTWMEIWDPADLTIQKNARRMSIRGLQPSSIWRMWIGQSMGRYYLVWQRNTPLD